MRANSIAIQDLMEAAGKSAAELLKERGRSFAEDVKFSINPNGGIVGLVVRRDDLSDWTAPELLDIATKAAEGMRDIAPGGTVAVQIVHGGIIAGYILRDAVLDIAFEAGPR
jgi:hypothetical protein